MKTCYFCILLFVIIAPLSTKAQNYEIGRDELSIGSGLFSQNQIRGFDEPVNGFMSFPSAITSALFVTYHHNISDRFACGVTAGMDNQWGDLTYGNPEKGPFTYDKNTGQYKRWCYTIAAEVTLFYKRKSYFSFYGFVGGGYSFEKANYTFYSGLYEQDFFYGTSRSLVPTNPYTADYSHFDVQVTPLGFRWGEQFAGFVEVGYGYKGIVCGGFSYRLK